MDVKHVQALIEKKGAKCVEHSDEDLKLLEERVETQRDVMSARATHIDSITPRYKLCETVEKYLRNCLTEESFSASGVYMGPFQTIVECCTDLAPGAFISPFGLLVIADSIGGNVVAVEASTGIVYWVDHTSYYEDGILYKDFEKGTWEEVDFTEENFEKGLVLLERDFYTFLVQLLNDELEERLDVLD